MYHSMSLIIFPVDLFIFAISSKHFLASVDVSLEHVHVDVIFLHASFDGTLPLHQVYLSYLAIAMAN